MALDVQPARSAEEAVRGLWRTLSDRDYDDAHLLNAAVETAAAKFDHTSTSANSAAPG